MSLVQGVVGDGGTSSIASLRLTCCICILSRPVEHIVRILDDRVWNVSPATHHSCG